MATLSSKLFTYYPEQRLFTVEHSEICTALRYIEAQYANDNHVGFYMKSARTNVEMLFILKNTECNHENEVQCWIYESENGLRVRVFND